MQRWFWTGLCIGFPVGMLLADRGASRGWLDAARRRTLALARDTAEQWPGNAGRNLAGVIERQIEPAAAERESSRIRAADIAHLDGGSVRLNQLSREELLNVYGIGPVTAQKILDGRPYRSDREVVERGIISEHTFRQLQRELLG